MELFKNTNFDFLKWKWPFIAVSLVLIAVGIGSIIAKGGLRYGIDFRGGAELKLRFKSEPPVDQIRTALSDKLTGEVSVQQITGQPEVLIGTEITDEKQLNANRQVIEDTLLATFGGPGGKLDLNNASVDQLADVLRGPLAVAGVAGGEQELMDLLTRVRDFRTAQGGILNSFDQLSSVEGVTPAVIQVFKDNLTLGPFTILSADVVGPKIGDELKRKAIYATLYSLAGMLIYIGFRFEWIYGVAAVIAVFHDTIITIGLFSLVDKEISLTVIAALLTLVGYSMNDTIVIFDRIRENIKITRRETMMNLVNMSVNQTLSRTVMTAGLTFLTAVSLWLFGGEVLNGFSFALVVGIVVGTYSSIFIASPILIFWHNFMASRKPAAAAPAAKQTAGSRKAMQR